ncbi:MAG: cation:proton antiporter [Bacteroidaceae bacterium]|nr:cation:proton antiporter [Bacteroidaceae bacterium]
MEWLYQYISFPITDPTWIFLLVLVMILFAPIVLEKLRIPHIIGMIMAGLLVGEHGFNILARDSSFELFGKVGLYYIMFLAGLEMNMNDFNENKYKAMTLGLLCFFIPITIGFVTNLSILHYNVATAVLLASMYASNTQVSYPIAIKYGISGQRGVSIAVGGTAVTDTLTLLVLAVVAGVHRGDTDGSYWILLVGRVIVIGTLIILLFPRIARWFFRRYDEVVTQYIFVLALVFLAAALMELAGMEGILGAFLTGLVLNRMIPHVSPLMGHLEFVGNALFIPYFLIGVGMLINLHVLFGSLNALIVAAVMIGVALTGKWIASFLVQKIFGLKSIERRLIYGLSTAQAAATLAAVMVGYNIILPDGSRLLNEDVLNGTILLILVTCIVSSLVTDHTARQIAINETQPDEHLRRSTEKILIPVAYLDTIDYLMELALMIRSTTFEDNILALHVMTDAGTEQSEMKGRLCLDKAAKAAAGANVRLVQLSRFDVNISSGIIHTAKEQDASCLVVGMHRKMNIMDSFYGKVTESLLKSIHREVIVAKFLMPLSTIRRIVVAVPPKAEYEAGFQKWLRNVCRMGAVMGCRVHFFANEKTTGYIQSFLVTKYKQTRTNFSLLEKWDDLLLLTGYVNYDHLLVIVSARRGSISYNPLFEELPKQIGTYFNNSSLMLVFPDQIGDEVKETITFSKPLGSNDVQLYEKIGAWLYKWFKKQ